MQLRSSESNCIKTSFDRESLKQLILIEDASLIIQEAKSKILYAQDTHE